MGFLLVHGLEGSGPEHWQTWLAERLGARGEHVAFPDLPDADSPRLESWIDALRAELAKLPAAETTVLCHSLGALLWLHHAETATTPVARVLLVAPPQPDVEVPGSVGFRPVPLAAAAVAAAAGETRLVCSTDDPWCPRERLVELGQAIGVEIDWLERAGHINTDAGYGPWPEVEAWALGARERLA